MLAFLDEAIAEIGDDLQLRPGLVKHGSVDPIGHGGHQHFRRFHRLHQFRLSHGVIVQIEAGIEQLAHARFHLFRQFSGDNNQSFRSRHIALALSC